MAAFPAGARLRHVCTALLVLATLAVAVKAAHAQVLYGSITGNVRDSSGSSVPGATITITSKETNLTRTVVSNEVGNYTVANVLAGNRPSAQAFRDYAAKNSWKARFSAHIDELELDRMRGEGTEVTA